MVENVTWAQLKSLYTDIALGMANHLLHNQVTAESQLFCSASKGTQLRVRLLCKSTHDLNIRIKKRGDNFHVTCANTESVKIGQFFRISPAGEIHTIKGFMGLEPYNKHHASPNKGNTANQIEDSLYTGHLKRILKKLPRLYPLAKRIWNALFPDKASDLSGQEGVSFQILSADRADQYIFSCYDKGGIYDEFLNAEGIYYPPQVAGNYYADVYSALLFLKMYEATNDLIWMRAAEESWGFLKRVYPQYKPAKIVWHHSDFKNAGLLELIYQYSERLPQFAWGKTPLVEDHYEPTNVFALRAHWKSLALKMGRKDNSIHLIDEDLRRLIDDQTSDGLYHDNIATYPDAHDLTYHQYSTACLGQALAIRHDPEAWESFYKAIRFTLNVLGPDGEAAYTGRASNNLHHSASAILAFHIAAAHTEDADFASRLIQGASAVASRTKRFQRPSGMIPTGLNHEVGLRMGWNHCETPYNGLAGYFLMRALEFQPKVVTHPTDLPLQTEHCWIADDAGFATLSNGRHYLVVFSGCDESYGWSENRHKTGCAGIALASWCGIEGMLPCLDFAIPSKVAMTDLPLLNGKAAFGRGHLSSNKTGREICYEHEYGGVQIYRRYQLLTEGLFVLTRLQADSEYNVSGIIAWPMMWHDRIAFEHDVNNKQIRLSTADGVFYLHYTCSSLPFLGFTGFTEKTTNARGFSTLFTMGESEVKGTLDSICLITRQSSISFNLDAYLANMGLL